LESRTQQPRSTRFIRHIEPDPNCTRCKQEETVEHILEYCPKIQDEPRESLIYQLVLESDKLEEERDQLTTRQKLDREIKNYVNTIIKTRKPQEEVEQENETTTPQIKEKHGKEKEQKIRNQPKNTRKATQ